MAYTLQDFTARVAEHIEDAAQQLGSDTLEKFEPYVQTAIKHFSRVSPLQKVKDFTGDGGYDYELPSDFVVGFSRIISVEYAAGDQSPTIIDPRDWMIYRTESANYLRFKSVWPGTTETIRIVYTTYHTPETIDDPDFDAVCLLAASFVASALAARYAEKQTSALQADSINFRTLAQEWQSISKMFRQSYEDAVLGAEKHVQPASVNRNFDLSAVALNVKRDFLFHRRGLR